MEDGGVEQPERNHFLRAGFPPLVVLCNANAFSFPPLANLFSVYHFALTAKKVHDTFPDMRISVDQILLCEERNRTALGRDRQLVEM
jgi:hypothetical protein